MTSSQANVYPELDDSFLRVKDVGATFWRVFSKRPLLSGTSVYLARRWHETRANRIRI